MIDTVKLRVLLTKKQLQQINSSCYVPHNFSGGWHPKASWVIQTPLFYKLDYTPNIMIRAWDYGPTTKWALYVTCSLPKLLFGHNLYELRNTDIFTVPRKLADLIYKITDIPLCTRDILRADVTRIDYGKNIISDVPGFTADILDLMSKVGASRWYDITQHEYLDKDDRTMDGHGIRYHTKTREVIFYDKYIEMRREGLSPSRMFDSATTLDREKIMKSLETKGLQVLRMETRYIGTKAIKAILKSVGLVRSPTFCNLFRSNLAKEIVNYEWKKYTDNAPIAELDNDEPYEMLVNLLKSGTNLHKSLEAIGLQLVMSKIGERKYRALVDTHNLTNTWRASKRLLSSCPRIRSESIQIVDEALDKFEPICGGIY